MKTLLSTLVALFIVGAVSAVWYGSNFSLTTGTYPDVQWGATLTIPANNQVTLTDGFNFSGGHLVLQENAVLEFKGNLTSNGTVTLGPGSKLIIDGNFSNNQQVTLNGGTLEVKGNVSQNKAITTNAGSQLIVTGNYTANTGNLNVLEGSVLTAKNLTMNGTNTFTGSVQIAEKITISSGSTFLGGCGEMRTPTLQVSGANLVKGSGFVVISQSFANGANSGWAGQQLTNSTGITVYYGGPATNANFGTAVMTTSSINPCQQLLPKSFDKFNAVQELNNYFRLEWVAPETSKTDRYEIEVSEDGVNFRTIEVIPSRGEAGSVLYNTKINLN